MWLYQRLLFLITQVCITVSVLVTYCEILGFLGGWVDRVGWWCNLLGIHFASRMV